MTDRDDSNDSAGVQGADVIENSADLTMLKRLSRHPEWRLPEECYDEVPQAMAEIIRDPNKSSRAKTSAARVLATLHGQNHAHTASALTVHHKVENGKPLWPVRPAAGEDGGEGPVAFLEQASEQDLRATAKVLAELGIL